MDSCENTLKNESEKFIKLERARIKYLFAPALLNYPKVHGEEDLEKLRDDYYTTIKNWIEEDKDYLNLNEYQEFISRKSAPSLRLPKERNSDNILREYFGNKCTTLTQNFKQEDVKQGFISLRAGEYVQNNGIKTNL